MSTRIGLAVMVAVLTVSASAGVLPTPTPAPGVLSAIQQVRTVAARLEGGPWNKFEYVYGAGIAVARPATKTVYVGALQVPGQANGGDAGFKLGSLSSSVAIEGVRAKVVFEVQSLVGLVACKVLVYEDPVETPVGMAAWVAEGVGSHDVTTNSFRMAPNKRYSVRAVVQATLGLTQPGGKYAIVKISEIKWQM